MITYYEIELQEADSGLGWEIIQDCNSIKEAKGFIEKFKREDEEGGISNNKYRIIANIRTEVF